MQSVIDVYIVTDGKHRREVDELAKLFISPIFDVNKVIVPKPIGVPNAGIGEQDLYRSYQVQWCLQKTSAKNPDRSVIFLKDSSITNTTSEKLTNLIKLITMMNADIDIFYLCRWYDACQQLTNITTLPEIDIKIARTYSPHGLQAMYFSPNGREIVLGNVPMKNKEYFKYDEPLEKKLNVEIYMDNITAYTTVDNIFSYDITRADHNINYNRTHVCRSIVDNPDSTQDSGNGVIWFILIVILIILISYAIIRIGR